MSMPAEIHPIVLKVCPWHDERAALMHTYRQLTSKCAGVRS